jgi:hypothetical protein
LKYPKINLETENGLPVVLKLNGSRSSNPGHLAVTNGGAYGSDSNVYYGRVSPEGAFFSNTWSASKGLQAVENLLVSLAQNPQAVATAYGRQTGNCCFCSKLLTDPQSVVVGYGPICAEHYGLPHGNLELGGRIATVPTQENATPLWVAEAPAAVTVPEVVIDSPLPRAESALWAGQINELWAQMQEIKKQMEAK